MADGVKEGLVCERRTDVFLVPSVARKTVVPRDHEGAVALAIASVQFITAIVSASQVTPRLCSWLGNGEEIDRRMYLLRRRNSVA